MQVKKENLKLGQPAIKWTVGALTAALMGAGIVSCGGGGGGSGSSLPPGQTLAESAAQVTPVGCTTGLETEPACDPFRLTKSDVERILKQGVEAAGTTLGTFAVVDRVGNVLAVYSTDNPDGNIRITSARNPAVTGGLEGADVKQSYAAIAKAITGAYLSSSGNAFSTRTASLIVQEHFYPGQTNEVSGPLFGVQFSQLPCGDLVRDIGQSSTAGPKRSPLGLAADPGGFPLYKNGVVVGGIGFISANGTYTLDPNPRDTDADPEEIIAWSASKGFEAPEAIRGNRISGGGPFLLFTDTNGVPVSGNATLDPNRFAESTGYYSPSSTNMVESHIKVGTPYGVTASGYRQAESSDFSSGSLVARKAFVLTKQDDLGVASGNFRDNRYAPRSAPNAITSGSSDLRLISSEVTTLLDKAYEIANRGRAQIRIPLSSAIQVTISVVDTEGNILGVVRTPDAPVFGTDVSLQKARSAMFMSKSLTAPQKLLIDTTTNTGPNARKYTDNPDFSSVTGFDGTIAFSARGFGNYARPYFPDGPATPVTGPFSRPFTNWSPFSTGLQLDLVAGKILSTISRTNRSGSDTTCSPENTSGTPAVTTQLPIRNGLQIFPGGFPIYRPDANGVSVLVGGIGISGDGIDQDDMISFLGLENARRSGLTIRHPLPADAPNRPTGEPRRIDSIENNASKSRYVNCPFSPFTDSNEQNVCRGI